MLSCVFFCGKNINAQTSVSVTKVPFVDNSANSQKIACSKNRVEAALAARAETAPKRWQGSRISSYNSHTSLGFRFNCCTVITYIHKENNAQANLQNSSEIPGFSVTQASNENQTLHFKNQFTNRDTRYSPPKISVFTVLQSQTLKNTVISYYILHQQLFGKI
jgi:hypothetical protein